MRTAVNTHSAITKAHTMANIALINKSGNTGKTTLAKQLATLFSAERIQIEDQNTSDGAVDLELSAARFKEVAGQLNIADPDDHFILDIGASNAKPMMEHFAKLKTTRAAMDFFVVPVVPAAKQITDSLATVNDLIKIGVEPSRIVVLLNNITDVDQLEKQFESVFLLRAFGVHVCDQAVLNSDVFELMKGQDESIYDLEASPPDFRALKKKAKEEGGDLMALGDKMVLQDLAENAAANLRAAVMATPLAAMIKAPAEA